jgi:Ca2+/Na+ antiporter
MNYLLYILLLLFGSNFMTQAAVFGIILLAYSILVFKKVTINKTMALLIVTCFAYIINYSINYGVPPLRIVFSRAVGLIILYMVGYHVRKKGNKLFL